MTRSNTWDCLIEVFNKREKKREYRILSYSGVTRETALREGTKYAGERSGESNEESFTCRGCSYSGCFDGWVHSTNEGDLFGSP